MAQTKQRAIHDSVLDALNNIKSSGSFAVSGQISEVKNDLGLTVNGVGKVKLPLSAKDAKALVKTVINKDVRNTWEVNAADLSFSNAGEWDAVLQSTISKVKDELGLADNVVVIPELYKLLVYEKGAKFKAHQDSEKTANHFATLVISLPSKHEGGGLVVSHEGREKTFDTSASSRSTYQYLAWYTDVTHEIRPVTSGFRLVLTYNLRSESPLTGRMNGEQADLDKLSECLRTWYSKPLEPKKSPLLAYILEHQYSESNLDFKQLKGNDHIRASILRKACEEVGFQCYLALLQRNVGSALDEDEDGFGYETVLLDDNDEVVAVLDEDDSNDGVGIEASTKHREIDPHLKYVDDTYLEHIVNSDAELVAERFPILESEIAQEDPFARLPDKEDYSGPTGNEGVTIEHWYRNSALVIVPNRSRVAFDFRLWLEENKEDAVRKYLEEQCQAVKTQDDQSAARTNLEKSCSFLFDIHREGSKYSPSGSGNALPHLSKELLGRIGEIAVEFDMFDVLWGVLELEIEHGQEFPFRYAPSSFELLGKALHGKWATREDIAVKAVNTMLAKIKSFGVRYEACQKLLQGGRSGEDTDDDEKHPAKRQRIKYDLETQLNAELLRSLPTVEKPKPEDALPLIKLGGEVGEKEFFKTILPFVKKHRTGGPFLLAFLDGLWSAKDWLNEKLIDETALAILTGGRKSDKIHEFLKDTVYSSFRDKGNADKFIELGQELGTEGFTLLLAPLVKHRSEDIAFIVTFLQKTREASRWNSPQVREVMAREVLNDCIDKLKYYEMGRSSRKEEIRRPGIWTDHSITAYELRVFIEQLKTMELPDQIDRLISKMASKDFKKMDPTLLKEPLGEAKWKQLKAKKGHEPSNGASGGRWMRNPL